MLWAFYICCIFIPCSIISITLIYSAIAKKIDLPQEKKVVFSISLELLYYAVSIVYFYLLYILYTYFTNESIFQSNLWKMLPFAIILVCILYFVQSLIINRIGKGEVKNTTLALVTVAVFLINIPTIMILFEILLQ